MREADPFKISLEKKLVLSPALYQLPVARAFVFYRGWS